MGHLWGGQGRDEDEIAAAGIVAGIAYVLIGAAIVVAIVVAACG